MINMDSCLLSSIIFEVFPLAVVIFAVVRVLVLDYFVIGGISLVRILVIFGLYIARFVW